MKYPNLGRYVNKLGGLVKYPNLGRYFKLLRYANILQQSQIFFWCTISLFSVALPQLN